MEGKQPHHDPFLGPAVTRNTEHTMEEAVDSKQFERLQTAIQFVVDDDRLDKRLKATRERSYRWEQGSWGIGRITDQTRRQRGSEEIWNVVCPTSGCLAGTIVTQAGDQMVVPRLSKMEWGGVAMADYCMDRQGVVHSIEERAAELIGGDPGIMFGAENKVQDLVDLATELAAENGFTLEIA